MASVTALEALEAQVIRKYFGLGVKAAQAAALTSATPTRPPPGAMSAVRMMQQAQASGEPAGSHKASLHTQAQAARVVADYHHDDPEAARFMALFGRFKRVEPVMEMALSASR